MIQRWIAKALAIPLIEWAARKLAAQIILAFRKFQNKKLMDALEKADTKEERDRAAQEIIDQFKRDN